MAIRPDNHITGDKAVRTISNNLIPEEWTISTPESDYGLDMLIEVVRNNQTTGRLFLYNLKVLWNHPRMDVLRIRWMCLE